MNAVGKNSQGSGKLGTKASEASDWIKSLADSAYRELILRSKPERFCLLFNLLRAKVGRGDVRFEFDRTTGLFVARSNRHARVFRESWIGYNSYRNGVAERGLSLGKSYLLDQITFRDGDVVVDCGANVGDLQIYFTEKNLKVEYIGIEPSPSEYACLKENVKPAQTFNLGLWNEDSNLDFYVSPHNADSSFLKPAEFATKVSIEAKRLDSFIDSHVRLLKVEAEGAEPEVLLGCTKMLDRIDFISADLGFERGPDQESTLPTVTNFLLQHNFELVDVTHGRIVALYRRIGLTA